MTTATPSTSDLPATSRSTIPARNRRRLFLGLLVIVVSLLVPLLILLATTNLDIGQPAVMDKARDDAVQLLIAGLFGAAITAAIALVAGEFQYERQVTDHQNERQRQATEMRLERRRQQIVRRGEEDQRDYEYRHRFLRAVTDAYNQMKAVRRSLHAYGLAAPEAEWSDAQRSAFFAQMLVLNEAQLAIEASKREARVRCAAFPGREPGTDGPSTFYTNVTRELERIESYMNGIIDEWERQPPQPTRPALAAFLGHPDKPGGIRGPIGNPDGPSTHLRRMEDLMAKSDPRIKQLADPVAEHLMVSSAA